MLRTTHMAQIDIQKNTFFVDPTKQITSDIDTDLCSCPTTCYSTDESSIGDYSLESSKSSHRHVTFDVDENDLIIEYRYVYPKNECLDSYTTYEEETERSIQLRNDCRRIKKKNSKIIRGMNDGYENSVDEEDATIFNEWAGSDLRGLESLFLSESVCQIQAYVQSTIAHYYHLRRIFGEASCEELIQYGIDEILSARSTVASENSRQFAIRLAAADEIATLT